MARRKAVLQLVVIYEEEDVNPLEVWEFEQMLELDAGKGESVEVRDCVTLHMLPSVKDEDEDEEEEPEEEEET